MMTLHMDFYRCPSEQLLAAVAGALPGLEPSFAPRARPAAGELVCCWHVPDEEPARSVWVAVVYGARGEQPTWWVSHPHQPVQGAVQVTTAEELADELATCLAAQQEDRP